MKQCIFLGAILFGTSQLASSAEGVGTLEPLATPSPQRQSPPPLGTSDASQIDHSVLSKQTRLRVNAIRLEGNTLFSDAELKPITEHYVGRELTAEDLRQLRHELTVFYINRGYINSGAVLPEQTVSAGELHIQIVEGHLTTTQLEGLQHLHESYLVSRIERHTANQPLNIKTLQNDLQLIQQNPLIQRINAELAPGLRPGEAILRARIEEANPWYMTLGGNNQGVPSVGAERFDTKMGHRNVLGFGDGLDGHLNVSAGQLAYGLNYSLPFTAWDSRIDFGYQSSDADVIERPFDEIHIFNRMHAYTLGITQPVWQTLEDKVSLGVSLERRSSQTFMMDMPTPFSKGCDHGRCDVSLVRFNQDWLHRTADQVLALRSSVGWGVDALGSTVHDDKPDSRFFSWQGQAQWIQLLWDSGVEMHLRGYAQLSDDALLSLEQFALGGRYSVRGYRENQWVRDNGFSSSIEFRIPVWGDGMLKLAPFFDMGRAWYLHDDITQKQHVLNSVGIGVLLDPTRQIHGEVYWAHAMRVIDNSSHDIQDDGIHFSVTYSPL